MMKNVLFSLSVLFLLIIPFYKTFIAAILEDEAKDGRSYAFRNDWEINLEICYGILLKRYFQGFINISKEP